MTGPRDPQASPVDAPADLAPALRSPEAPETHHGAAQARGESSGQMAPAANPPRRRLENRRGHELVTFRHDHIAFTAGLGRFPDGELAEIFLNVPGKSGTAIDVVARDAAVLASLALQHGCPADTLRRALMRNVNGTASGALGALLDLLAADAGEVAS
jgi:hypothetical protein